MGSNFVAEDVAVRGFAVEDRVTGKSDSNTRAHVGADVLARAAPTCHSSLIRIAFNFQVEILVDAWQCRNRRVIVDGLAPLVERLEQSRQMDLSKVPRRLGQIRYGSFQHRSHAHAVAGGVVVKGNSNLNQSLKKLLVFGRGSAPDVFEGLVSVEELGVVE